MARIEWVRSKLDNWARWVVQRDARGTGYPKRSAFLREAGCSSSTDSSVPVNDLDARTTHDAVESIRLQNGGLWLAVQCHYVGNPQAHQARRRPMTTEEIATRMNIGRRMVQVKLEEADQMIAIALRRADERVHAA